METLGVFAVVTGGARGIGPMFEEVDALRAQHMNIPISENERQVAAGVFFDRMG